MCSGFFHSDPARCVSLEDPALLKDTYTDWCTAVIAEHLTGLSSESIFRAVYGEPDNGRRPARSHEGPESEAIQSLVNRLHVGHGAMDERVQRLVAEVARELALPPFEEWVESYRAEPERYNPLILGLRASRTATPRSA